MEEVFGWLVTQAAEKAVQEGSAVLPGLIFNSGKTVEEPLHLTGGGRGSTQVAAGRLECTMQNLADSLAQRFPTQVHFFDTSFSHSFDPDTCRHSFVEAQYRCSHR